VPTEGIPTELGTNTILFITITDNPQNQKATYPCIVVADRPQKSQPRQVQVTVGGDQIQYPHNISTKISNLATVKILLNGTISTPNARFMCLDIKDFYLITPMSRAEYMRIPGTSIPAKIHQYSNLAKIQHNSNIYVKIIKGMYRLPQAGKLANDKRLVHLNTAGYQQCPHTAGLFTHESQPIAFCQVAR
jgi:hypothetical protein